MGDEAPLGEGDLVLEIYARHSNKSNESRQLCAVLGAVLEVIKEQGLDPTPTALFAALMMSFEGQAMAANPEVVASMCNLLGLVLARTPNAVLRSKLTQSLSVLLAILEQNQSSAPASKAILLCLQQVVAAADPNSWLHAAKGFSAILRFVADPRPKVRKRAQAGCIEVLAALQRTAGLKPASESILALCAQIMPRPAKAAAAAAAAANKQARADAEAAVTSAVSDALHLMGTLKAALPTMHPSTVGGICEQLLALLPLRQPLLTRHATDVLHALCTAPGDALAPGTLAGLMGAIVDQREAWDRRDVDTVVCLLRLTEAGYIRLFQLDADMCAKRLPKAVASLAPHLGAEQEGVVYATAECLKSMVRSCLSDEGVQQAAAGGKGYVALVAREIQGLLAARYHETWGQALPVVGALVERLGPASSRIAPAMITTLGEMYGEGREELACAQQLAEAMGSVIRAAGPEAVLQLLPLELEKGVTGTADQTRAWLLPLLRTHVTGARLGYFAEALVPLAQRLAGAREAATQAGRMIHAKRAEAMEIQLWMALPAFANWAVDVGEAFRFLARDLGAHLQNRPELRGTICHALKVIIEQNTRAAEAESSAATPLVLRAAAAGVATEKSGVPESHTPEVARANLAAVGAFSKNFLPLLFNLFVGMAPEQRGAVHATIEAFASVTEAGQLAMFFRTVMKKLIKVTADAALPAPPADALLEGGADAAARRCTFMELAIALGGNLDEECTSMLYKAARPNLTDADSSVQKKAYKLFAHICTRQRGFAVNNIDDVVEMLLATLPSVASTAKRNRLRCIRAALEIVLANNHPRADEIVTSIVGEIMLCTKESNKKARTEAYDVLVGLARSMGADDDDGMEDGEGEGGQGVRKLVTAVLAGLAGSTPHMISAAVMALARLLYQFPTQVMDVVPDAVPTVLLLLRSKNREIIKSVLGFCKVAVARLSAGELLQHVVAMQQGLLIWSGDSKNHFKMKVRVIVERTPEEHRKLLVNIRKTRERAEKKKRSMAGSQMEGDGGESAGGFTTATGRMSTWHDSIFDDGDSDGGGSGGGRSRAPSRGARTATTARTAGGRGGARLMDGGTAASGEPMDLLDSGIARKMLRAERGDPYGGAAPMGAEEEGDERDFPMDMEGKMMVTDVPERRKRGRDDDDDDARSTRTKSHAGGKSESGRSRGGKSAKSAKSAIDGGRFKTRKGTGGDNRGKSKLEPFAYWPLDQKMLNRRTAKQKTATRGLKKVVVQGTAARGEKAKRQRRG